MICLSVCVITLISGCALGSKSMQMDSTSRMPWFGFEFLERKKKSDGPAFRAVRNNGLMNSRIDTAELLGGKSKESSGSRKSNVLPTTDQSLAVDLGTAKGLDFQ